MEARRRDFAIRMALGATRTGLLRLAFRDGATAAVAGAVLGIPLSWLLATVMRDMLYEVAPFDPLTAVLVLCALFAVTFVASLVPARRASMVDPARAMRAD
jgi:ABC-type antimicrobial peptide transport system permease subunit